MESSSSDQWYSADPRQQKPRPTPNQPLSWQQAHSFPLVGPRHDQQAYQPTVKDVFHDPGIYYGSSSTDPYGRQPHRDPYAWAQGSGGARPNVPLSSPIRATTTMASRRSFAEPHATFSPPSLVSDSSTLSSASSNFSAVTPTFDQQPQRRFSQQAFPDQIDRDALARANRRMASDRANLSDSPFYPEKYDPFAPLQPRAALAAGSGLYAEYVEDCPSFDAQRGSTSTTFRPHRAESRAQPQTPSTDAEDASSFKSHLNSELNRRKVVEKTVVSIRSDRARAVAQAKENARRTDWAKDVLLKFPVQCALAESLRPEDMMASITKCGIFELTASIA